MGFRFGGTLGRLVNPMVEVIKAPFNLATGNTEAVKKNFQNSWEGIRDWTTNDDVKLVWGTAGAVVGASMLMSPSVAPGLATSSISGGGAAGSGSASLALSSSVQAAAAKGAALSALDFSTLQIAGQASSALASTALASRLASTAIPPADLAVKGIISTPQAASFVAPTVAKESFGTTLFNTAKNVNAGLSLLSTVATALNPVSAAPSGVELSPDTGLPLYNYFGPAVVPGRDESYTMNPAQKAGSGYTPIIIGVSILLLAFLLMRRK